MMVTKKPREFMIQWHITNRCDFNCRHCYMTLEERTNNADELPLTEAFTVIDDLVKFSKIAQVHPRICFTGGNPLLHRDLPALLTYAQEQGCISHLLGNPVLDQDLIAMLKEKNVSRYQLSFDGLEEEHDYFRGPGAFQKGLKTIEQLSATGIQVAVMNTVTKKNAASLPQLIRTVIDHGAQRFDFSRLVPIGNGQKLEQYVFTPTEYHQFMKTMYREYNQLIDEGIPDKFLGTKDPLWSLLLYEQGELHPPTDGQIYTGCSIGKNGFCMEPDGTIYACRRMPEAIANIKNSPIRDFFFNNPKMNEYRQVDKIESCKQCELISVCRGCRAVAAADTGSYFGKDPQCWKQTI